VSTKPQPPASKPPMTALPPTAQELRTMPFANELVDYLDWPVQIDENEAWCANPECLACPGNGTIGIGSVYGLTARSLAAGIAAHANRA